MATKHEPTDTKLFHIPIYIDGKSYNMCIYINNLYTNGTPALMIVPFPKLSEDLIGMVDITTTEMKKFRDNTIDLFKFDKYEKRCKSIGFSASKCIVVHKIGNYNISIAKNKNELLNNINWNIFTRPPDFEKRISVLNNKNLYPYNCCYVVAQAQINIKNDGFGIVYKNHGYDYIPTAHEQKDNNRYHYNVKCYHFSTEKQNNINLEMFKDNNFNLIKKDIIYNVYTDYNVINNLCDIIYNHIVKFENGTYKRITIPEINKISYIELDGMFNNANIYTPNLNKDTIIDNKDIQIFNSNNDSNNKKIHNNDVCIIA